MALDMDSNPYEICGLHLTLIVLDHNHVKIISDLLSDLGIRLKRTQYDYEIIEIDTLDAANVWFSI